MSTHTQLFIWRSTSTFFILHQGVMTIARKVHDLTRDPAGLPVLAPPPFRKWVDSYIDLFQPITTTDKHVRLFAINRVYEAPPQPVMAFASGFNPDLVSPPAVNPIWQLRPSNDPIIKAWKRLLTQLKLKVRFWNRGDYLPLQICLLSRILFVPIPNIPL